jgi:hypothetical protein
MPGSKPKLKVRTLDEMFKKITHTLIDQTTNSIFDSFHTDIGDRQTFLDEVARWKTRWNMVDEKKPQTLLEKLNVTNQNLYSNIYAVLITMPVSSASSEHSFSAMRRIKNCLRATMVDERLSNLSLLHIHRTRNLSVEDVINTFAVRKNTTGLYLITSPCCWT